MPSPLICDPMVRGTEQYSAVMQCRPINPAECNKNIRDGPFRARNASKSVTERGGGENYVDNLLTLGTAPYGLVK